jgi:hypothetical protein
LAVVQKTLMYSSTIQLTVRVQNQASSIVCCLPVSFSDRSHGPKAQLHRREADS